MWTEERNRRCLDKIDIDQNGLIEQEEFIRHFAKARHTTLFIASSHCVVCAPTLLRWRRRASLAPRVATDPRSY